MMNMRSLSEEMERIGSAAEFLRKGFGDPPFPDVRVGPLVESREFAQRLKSDIAAWTDLREGQNTPFTHIKQQLRLCTPLFEARAWERVLATLRASDSAQYDKLHKGEPFYWLAVDSYHLRDYEGALFYMDCALSEDVRRWPDRWHEWPAGLFVLIDRDNENQAAIDDVRRIGSVFDVVASAVNAKFALTFTMAQYRAHLVYAAMSQGGELRSVVTAFVTFLLEFAERRQQLTLLTAPGQLFAGTAEPFFVHLFKGCVVFESLLKFGFAAHLAKTRTLGSVLQTEAVYRALGFSVAPVGLGSSESVDQLCHKVELESLHGCDASIAIRATWNLRNMIGHNLALPAPPTLDQYSQLFEHVVGAIARVIATLPAVAPPIATTITIQERPPGQSANSHGMRTGGN